jgi:hypothetical protein
MSPSSMHNAQLEPLRFDWRETGTALARAGGTGRGPHLFDDVGLHTQMRVRVMILSFAQFVAHVTSPGAGQRLRAHFQAGRGL